jgi:hypothetical protein
MTEKKSTDFKYGFLMGTVKSIKYYLDSTIMTPEEKLNSIRSHIEYTYQEGIMENE